MSKSQSIYQIYDKIFKKILTLSSTAVINLINGLFDTDHPPDSTIVMRSRINEHPKTFYH